MDVQNRVDLLCVQIVGVLGEQALVAVVVKVERRKVVQIFAFQNAVDDRHPNREIDFVGPREQDLRVKSSVYSALFAVPTETEFGELAVLAPANGLSSRLAAPFTPPPDEF